MNIVYNEDIVYNEELDCLITKEGIHFIVWEDIIMDLSEEK